MDVGQGDSIFIEAPNGNQVIIDAGPGDIVLRQVSSVLPYYDRTINMFLATHPDQDHIGGVPSLIKRFNFNYYSLYENREETTLTGEITSLIEDKKITVQYLKAGDRIILDEDVYLDILWPTDKYLDGDRNDLSLVVKLSYLESSFLLTGDASTKIESILIAEYGDELDVDVLKLGHHGSKTSTSQEFLEATSPDIVVVSAGEGNRYGHPSQEVVDRIAGMEIKKTTEGSVVLMSDGETIWSK